jgi:hypothetical protein
LGEGLPLCRGDEPAGGARGWDVRTAAVQATKGAKPQPGLASSKQAGSRRY